MAIFFIIGFTFLAWRVLSRGLWPKLWQTKRQNRKAEKTKKEGEKEKEKPG
ncbi:MAG TPA: hypothetical protein DDY13_18660 [Cytophagales bacterium]|nr:hypothetical protein [Cytophagales bacterium]